MHAAYGKRLSVEEIMDEWQVLYVDEDGELREQVNAELSRLGCEIDVTGDEQTAWELLTLNDYDVIFLPLKDADVDGYYLTQKLRQLYIQKEHQPFVVGVVDENSPEVEQKRWLMSGMDGCIRLGREVEPIIPLVGRMCEALSG